MDDMGERDVKRLSVSLGGFSCKIEGYDDPMALLREVTRHMRELSSGDVAFLADSDRISSAVAEADIERIAQSDTPQIAPSQKARPVQKQPAQPGQKPAPKAAKPARVVNSAQPAQQRPAPQKAQQVAQKPQSKSAEPANAQNAEQIRVEKKVRAQEPAPAAETKPAPAKPAPAKKESSPSGVAQMLRRAKSSVMGGAASSQSDAEDELQLDEEFDFASMPDAQITDLSTESRVDDKAIAARLAEMLGSGSVPSAQNFVKSMNAESPSEKFEAASAYLMHFQGYRHVTPRQVARLLKRAELMDGGAVSLDHVVEGLMNEKRIGGNMQEGLTLGEQSPYAVKRLKAS